ISCEAVSSCNFTSLLSFAGVTLPTVSMCDASDCGGKGVCVGIKAFPLCLCEPGYTGAKCQTKVEETGSTIPCTAADCNGKGLCLGIKAQFVCLCEL
ncbi:hypothetical protein PFISCL1PPCAC_13410, partial [Pristionchus fissidentatus]